MIFRPGVLYAGLILLACSSVIQAHQVAGGTHEHVWRQQDYGKDFRQGHSVNGSAGSITIWSPTTHNKFGASNPVRFARPAPIARQTSKQSASQAQSQAGPERPNDAQSNIPRIKSLAPSRYGKDHKRDYGK